MKMNRLERRHAVRRARLQMLKRQYDTDGEFARALGYGESVSYINQMLNGHSGIGDSTADRIEAAMRLQPGWLDIPADMGGDLMQPGLTRAESRLVEEFKRVYLLAGPAERGLFESLIINIGARYGVDAGKEDNQ